MTDCPEIELVPKEIFQAAHVGIMRQVENLSKKRKDAFGASDKDGWQLHIEGALGEFAFAKYRGIFWSGAHAFRGDDVGRWQVRTRSRHSYELPIHPGDPDDRRFVLLTGTNGLYKIRGWILGKDGKNQEWWNDPAGDRPAFFVPHGALQGWEEQW